MFISSTVKDNATLRKLIQERLSSKNYIQPILSEDPKTFPKTIDNVNTFEASVKAVESADIFLLIIGKRYGEIDPASNLSVTEAEFCVTEAQFLEWIEVQIENTINLNYNQLETKPNFSATPEDNFDSPLPIPPANPNITGFKNHQSLIY
ncbi:MAG: DUF4062 domain-containing protein [Candidatus Helarchaeota archaeon]|nr:DUF4062 domain-containing protein [Candidatus Helarchaeota archaeon]